MHQYSLRIIVQSYQKIPHPERSSNCVLQIVMMPCEETEHPSSFAWIRLPTTLFGHRLKLNKTKVSWKPSFCRNRKQHETELCYLENDFLRAKTLRNKRKTFFSESQVSLNSQSVFVFYFFVLFSTPKQQEGANGEGVAIVSSLSSFDRELQKEYLLPIVIKVSKLIAPQNVQLKGLPIFSP